MNHWFNYQLKVFIGAAVKILPFCTDWWALGQLTGWKSPIAGGPSRKTLSTEDRQHDDQARLIVAQELGHDRTEISANYIGT